MISIGRVTIKDIAKEVGVSHPTVSKALANIPGINKETRKKILETAERMNYIPNVAAQRLAKRKSRCIGFVWNNFENLFQYHLCTMLQKEAAKRKIELLITMSDDAEAINILYDHCVDFMFCWNVNHFNISEKKLRDLKKNGCGFMFVDNYSNFSDNLIIDRVTGIRNTVDYLIECGHSNISFFGIRTEKMDAFKEALSENGLNNTLFATVNASFYDDYHIYENELYEKFSKMWYSEDRPTALFLDSQNLAMGFANVLRKLNISVPDDLSVITYDDIPEYSVFSPALTTLSPSLTEISNAIINRFEEYYNEKVKENINITIVPELVKRDSVKIIK